VRGLSGAWGLARRAVQGWMDDSAASMGAALAFYTMLSLAPLLLVVVGVAGIFWGRTEAQSLLMDQITSVVGDRAAAGIQLVLENAGSGATEGVLPAVIGFATALFGAATVFNELQQDLDRIWRHHARKSGVMGMLRSRLLTFGMVLTVGFLLMVSLVVSAGLAALSGYLGRRGEDISIVWRVLDLVVPFGVVTLLFALIYKYLPDAKLKWRDVWLGALVTAGLFVLGKELIGLYLGKSSLASTYGAVGSVMILLLWVYYSCQLLLFGAEFTRVYSQRQGAKPRPESFAEKDPDAVGKAG